MSISEKLENGYKNLIESIIKEKNLKFQSKFYP